MGPLRGVWGAWDLFGGAGVLKRRSACPGQQGLLADQLAHLEESDSVQRGRYLVHDLDYTIAKCVPLVGA